MNIETYSVILSISGVFLGLATALSIFGYYFSPSIREKLSRVSYFTWIKLLGALAGFATLGALTYQFVYVAPVCPLCWWQRIFMFPIVIIAIVSLWVRAKGNHLIVGIMATLGGLFAAYQYYGHYQKYVLGNPFLIPCSTNLLEPSCSESPIVTFSFVTIPLMALVVFVALFWISYLAHQKLRQEQ